MKLVYITGGLPFGPGETFFLPELLELRRRGHDVSVLPLMRRGDVVHEDAARMLPYTLMPELVSASMALPALRECIGRPLSTTRALATMRRSRTPRILAKNLAIVPKALWLARYVREHGIDHIHAQWVSAGATIAMIASELSGVPWSCTAHRSDIAEDNLIHDKTRTARFVRVISEQGARKVASAAGPHAAKVRVERIGIVPCDPMAEHAHAESGPFRLVMAAHFYEVKGHQYLVEAMKLLGDRGAAVKLDLAGPGPLKSAVERQVTRLGLQDAIRFLGVVPHRALIEQVTAGSWNAAVLPSIVTDDGVHEGVPVFLAEAMCAGLPVIATPTGAIPELVDERTGLLVPPRDPGALADAIQRLAGDHALRRRLGAAARERVLAEFAVEGVVERFERLVADSR